MSEPRHPIPQMDELSDAFRALGAREAADPRSRWRQWFDRRRRALGIGVIAVGLVGGGAATATQFISEGEPQRLKEPNVASQQPSRTPQVVMTAPDPTIGLPWGLAIYTSHSGEACAYVGQLRGERLGVVRDGKFRAFAGPTRATCAPLEPDELTFDRWTDRATRRVAAFGRAGSAVRFVRLEIGPLGATEKRTMRVGPGGSYLFILDEDPARIAIFPLDAQKRDVLPEP